LIKSNEYVWKWIQTMSTKKITGCVFVNTWFVCKKISIDSESSFYWSVDVDFSFNLAWISTNCMDISTIVFVFFIRNRITISTFPCACWCWFCRSTLYCTENEKWTKK
jgi:hypothetical protein